MLSDCLGDLLHAHNTCKFSATRSVHSIKQHDYDLSVYEHDPLLNEQSPFYHFLIV